MHQAIVEKLRANPELLWIAHDNLKRWAESAGRSQAYLDAWRKLLSKPLEELAVLMIEESERMTAMRQASPFAGILSPKERWAIYDAFAVRTPGRSGADDR